MIRNTHHTTASHLDNVPDHDGTLHIEQTSANANTSMRTLDASVNYTIPNNPVDILMRQDSISTFIELTPETALALAQFILKRLSIQDHLDNENTENENS